MKASSAFSEDGRLMCDVKFAAFSQHSRKKPGQDADEKELSMLLQEALLLSVRVDTFPKAMLEVHVMVLQSDGGTLQSLWRNEMLLTRSNRLGQLNFKPSQGAFNIDAAFFQMFFLFCFFGGILIGVFIDSTSLFLQM
jgi:hypothetical protein